MTSQTDETALETAIEQTLTERHGYESLPPSGFDKQFAVDAAMLWGFLEATQEAELKKLQRSGPDWQRRVLERLDRTVKKQGLLYLLKKGLDVDDAHLSLFFPAPTASSAAKVKERFAANRFGVMRQVHYSAKNPKDSIDMALFVNGLPLCTLELKNPWTGQNARYHAQQQYRADRDASQPLLNFGRTLVHFAVDTDEVYMTTKLCGAATFFLPFNKGHNHGAGNPPNPDGHKSAYLWEEVFSPKSVANIIQHFVRLDGSAKDALEKRTLFFPRYHQMEVVRRLLDNVSREGVGKTYLIQHSAGSGKSNSITWAAYGLIEAYPASAKVPGAKEPGLPLFDSVIVVTDRRLLDKQLRENIKEFSEVKNIIAPAYRSADLKAALEQGKKIIITTIQKFPFIIDGIADLSDKRFAVIIDEAHSSQSGSAHDNMNRVMGKNGEEPEAEDVQEMILQAMQSRKMRGNASYFAFTATPKNSTLEKFGIRQEDGSFRPFHLYSMKQAIEEGFILDVLANYTTYKSYYQIQKSIAENPLFNTKKAQKKLRAFVESNKESIGVKAEIMLEHFTAQAVKTKKLKGKAKGMVVTQNIETAIRYHKALTALLEKQGLPFRALIAFSGEKEVDGIKYTEAGINGFGENETAEKFDTDEYRLLVVANKYLTGFDQPKLCVMYVDKKLQGVLAVQALSRLNRAAPKWGKRSEDLFVLDFFNTTDEIKTAFDPFYTATTLSGATDVNVLHDLKNALDDTGVYEQSEVEAFVSLYFGGADAQRLSPLIDTTAARFNNELGLEENDKADIKIKAKQFVKIYGQMAAIMEFEIVGWEKLFWFLKFLIPKLKVQDPNQEAIDELLSSVDLSSYGLERVKISHTIGLDESESQLDPQNPNLRGAHGEGDQKDPLDEIVRSFNERWFQAWEATPESQRVKLLNLASKIQNHPDFARKFRDNGDIYNRELAYEKMFDETSLKSRQDDIEFYRLMATDPAFKTAVKQTVLRLLGAA